MQTAATDSLVGRSLEGRYRILERIARGGMSTVYAAVDERLDRLVAVKVMSPALSSDPAFSDRFAREARAAARLTHLNAVSVYDQGHELGAGGHHVFLVMELVEGRTLRELIRERGRLDTAEAVSIMEPVLSALSAAHRAGLVHRDVKPENILLSDEGVVKVADFGLARAVETDPSSTRTGLMMGTVAYCAPEQIATGSCDPRSDVYSAGIVLFELLTGHPPYRGDSAMNVAYQHVHSRVPAPSSRAKGIPYEIDELVIAATDSDPASRPSDAAAFLAEIGDLRGELALPVVPVPPRPGERMARLTKPPPAGYRTPDSATTDSIRTGAGRHDTAFDPRHPANGYRGGTAQGGGPPPQQQHRNGPPGDPTAPPPPVVIPPKKRHGRRRGLLVALLVLLLGLTAGYASWYFASGRYSQVPNLRDATQSSAVSQLQDAGYRVNVQPGPEFDDKIAKGHVVRTDPDAETRAIRGTRIVVFISAGPHLYPVRSVRGMSVDEARRTLQSGGRVTIVQDVKQENSDTVAEGKVTRTDPKSGSQVRAGQPITIYVSAGPPIIDVPTVPQGTSQADAEKRLKRAKFSTTVEQQYSDSVSEGEVISITPSDRARRGSRITVVVSRGPETVTVPVIPTGTSVDDAKRTIRAANLVPDVRIFGGGAGTPGAVIAVTPRGGTSVRTGSTVVIYAIPS